MKRHSDEGLLYMAVLTNPTMGGVTASFSMLADVILAEKGAMIGFAGPRVIEQNTGAKLLKGFQTAEFQLKHGFVDDIVPRMEMRNYLGHLIKLHNGVRCIKHQNLYNRAVDKEPRFENVSAWENLLKARSNKRPTSGDYINTIFEDFLEFHGEGGSGGALALGVTNEVWILENAVYSVLTPKGYASILWKDNTKANEAAELMKMTSGDMRKNKAVDKVFEEISKENRKIYFKSTI